jgi:prepilin-type N-terminal cleavage/methylation domain-containing protein
MRSPSIFSRRAFTLIELLVVIAILAILMSMLFPAVNKALDNAKRTQAKNDVTQIAAALIAYQNEYGKLPLPGGSTGDLLADTNGEFYDALAGTDTANNPRGIVFLTAPRTTSGHSGRENGTGPYLDPWGNAYFVSMDGDYNNQLQGPDGSTNQLSVLVWSKGNKKYTSDYNNPAKYIKSWQ